MMTLQMMGKKELPTRGSLADRAGMVASIGCAVHCAAMPLLLASLPTFGLSWLATEGFHQGMAVICFGLAIAAFVPGWRKHRCVWPAVWGGIGLVLLTTAAFVLEDRCCTGSETESIATAHAECEGCQIQQVDPSTPSLGLASSGLASSDLASLVPFVTPLGGLLIVVGHLVNHRMSCRCHGNDCCEAANDSM